MGSVTIFQVLIPPGACEKVTIDLGLGDHWLVTTSQYGIKSDKKQNSEFIIFCLKMNWLFLYWYLECWEVKVDV